MEEVVASLINSDRASFILLSRTKQKLKKKQLISIVGKNDSRARSWGRKNERLFPRRG